MRRYSLLLSGGFSGLATIALLDPLKASLHPLARLCSHNVMRNRSARVTFEIIVLDFAWTSRPLHGTTPLSSWAHDAPTPHASQHLSRVLSRVLSGLRKDIRLTLPACTGIHCYSQHIGEITHTYNRCRAGNHKTESTLRARTITPHTTTTMTTIGYEMNTHSASAWARLIWRIGALVLLMLALVYFTPVVAYQSVMKLPIDKNWAYVLVMVALSFLNITIESFFDAGGVIFVVVNYIFGLAWLAAFGIFAKIYLQRGKGKGQRYKGTNTAKMQIGTWILLVTTIWWIGYAAYCTVAWLRRRRQMRAGSEAGSYPG